MSKRIHSLEGREEHVRELGNVAHGKQELTCWRGGRGRSGLASLEMWHIANKVPFWGRKREEWVSELRNVACCKTGTHLLEGRKREGRVGELGNVACCKTRTHLLEGRKREEWVGELGNMAWYKMRTHLLEGRKCGRGGLVSSEMWHIANEDSLPGGEGEGGRGGGAQKCGT